MTAERLVDVIRAHGHPEVTATADGRIRALESGTQRKADGSVVPYDEWVTLPATVKAVRDWLGY